MCSYKRVQSNWTCTNKQRHTHAHTKSGSLSFQRAFSSREYNRVTRYGSKDGSNVWFSRYGSGTVHICVCVYVCVFGCVYVWMWCGFGFLCVAYLVGVSKTLTPILFSKPIITSTCYLYAYSHVQHIDLMAFYAKETARLTYF